MNPESLKDFRRLRPFSRSGLSGASFEWAAISDDSAPFLVKKTTRDKKKLILQYQWLQKFKGVQGIPFTKKPVEAGQAFSYEIEFLSQADPFFEVAQDASCERVKAITKNLLELLTLSIYTEPSLKHFPCLKNYYQVKVLNNLEQCLSMSHRYGYLLKHPMIIINSRVLKNFSSIKANFSDFIQKMSEKISDKQCLIHGDLTAENILITESNETFLIDPNPGTLLSHPIVDLAKLWQSFDAYFEINKDIEVMVNDVELSFKETHCQHYDFIKKTLTSEFRKYYELSYEDILMHEAIHFARLLPYALVSSENLFLWAYAKFIEISNRLLM